MSDIVIFMCCQNGFEYIPPLCVPIQCGSALVDGVVEICSDCDGENISEKNREYCELTAHYYAWKNISADYYGFCHDRRFFCASDSRRPYLVRGTLSEGQQQKLFRDENYWRALIESHDILAPFPEDMGISVREHYCTTHRCPEDLDLFMDILAQKAPALKTSAENYLAQRKQYCRNMFVMKRGLFFEYCEYLFGILEEFDRRRPPHSDAHSDRTDKYLGEIFTGIFLSYCAECGANIAQAVRLDTGCSAKKRVACTFLTDKIRRKYIEKSKK